MMDYEKLAEIILKKEEDVLYFYDRKAKSVVPIYVYGTNEESNVYRMENDRDNFILVPRPHEEAMYYDYALNHVKEPDIQQYLLDATGARSMQNRLKKHNLTEDYNSYFYSETLKELHNWAYVNELDETMASDSELKEVYAIAIKSMEKKPWRDFADMDYFKIHYQGDEIYYIILGNSGECFGIEMFYNANGFRDLILETTLSQMDPSSIYPMVARNALTVYFDSYEDLIPLEQEKIEDMGEDITDGRYPNFTVTHVGHMPKPLESISECYKFKKGLEALNLFMDSWNKKPRKIDPEEPTHFEVTIDERTNAVSCKKNNKAFDSDSFPFQIPMIRDDEIDSMRENLRVKNGLAYADIKAIPAGEGESLKPYYMILVYDCTKERILNTTPHEATDGDYVSALLKGFHKDMESERMPSHVMVRNPLVSIILTVLYGDKLTIDFQMDPFDPIEEVTMGLYDSFSDEHTMDMPHDEYIS